MLSRIAGSDVMPESFRNCLYTRRFRRVAVRQTQAKTDLLSSAPRLSSAAVRRGGQSICPGPQLPQLRGTPFVNDHQLAFA